MSLLTWLPPELRVQLRTLDPAHELDPVSTPSMTDLIKRGNDSSSALPDRHLMIDRAPSYPRRRWAMSLSAAALIVLIAIAAVVTRLGTSAPEQSGEHGASPTSTSVTSGASGTQIAERLWSSFPVTAAPRPIVLVGAGIDYPTRGFADVDTKLAFVEGRIHLAASVPASPGELDGYPLIDAVDAVAQLHPASTAPPPSGSPPATLQITGVTLVRHDFLTDRGVASLPTWQIHIARVPGDLYVLAIAPAGRFAVRSAGRYPFEDAATLSNHGTELTFPFVSRNAGSCPIAATYALRTAQTSTAVVLATAVTTTVPVPARATTRSALGRVGPAVTYFCVKTGAATTAHPLMPGEAGTRTITLTAPLGHRVVVDGNGNPFNVTVRN